jgi:peptidoglycan/LPS O-acetylase OafA/YrhL
MLRIWPAYFAIIVLVCIYARTIGTAQQLTGLLTFTLNFQMQGHQWPLPGLEALWSISVEEQFYLLAPQMYLALRSRYHLAFIVAVVAVANVVRFSYLAASTDSVSNGGLYYATYAYADTFVIGAAVAKYFIEGQVLARVHKSVAFGLSIFLLAVILRLWGSSAFPPYPNYAAVPYALTPFAGALILIAILPYSQTILTRFLSSVVIRTIGDLSYSLYLVHIFVLNQVQRLNLPHVVQFVIYNAAFLCGVFLLALALHYAIERPFLILKNNVNVESIGKCCWAPLLVWSMVMSGIYCLIVGANL